MTARNDITGDNLSSKKNSNDYREGWDRIFGNKDDSHLDDAQFDQELLDHLEEVQKITVAEEEYHEYIEKGDSVDEKGSEDHQSS